MTSDSSDSRPAPAGSEPRQSPPRRALEWLFGRDVLTSPGAAAESPVGDPGRSVQLRLALLSFLMLFVELALIRWLGANIVYLSYYSNFVLLGSFLGIGIGFLRARSRINLFPWTPVALALLTAFVLRFPVQISHTSGTQLIFFGALKTTGLPTWLMLPVIFLAVAAVMTMIGEGVARTFVQFKPLDAYRLDILGSIVGIAAFSTLSFFNAKPLAWGIITAIVLLVLSGTRIGIIQFAALASLAGLLTANSLISHDLWSPYYRITVGARTQAQTIPVMVNGIPHQAITAAAKRPAIFYQPYTQAPRNPLNNVLVVGAGTGNDVAGALRMGAKHIDAVEIDPMIYKLGTKLNSDRPYQSPRVSAHINDGRAFLSQTKKKYDLILFALPDSLTLVAGQSSLRLESYLFTLQAIQSARAHLVPGTGVFAMYNYYRTTWLKDRLADTLDVAFGHAPCASSVGQHQQQLSVLTVSVSPAAVRCVNTWHRPANVLPPSTDDHPFVYLASNTIPSFYLLTLGLILLASLVLVRTVSGPYRKMTGFADLFFMGAAFMLLETKSVVQFALLFGTTWFVNALVFAGVLIAVLAAVETSRRVVIRRPQLLYAGLLAALAVAWVVPQESLLSLSVIPRFVLAVLIAFAPIFLANLVFTQRFRDVSDSTVAFAANLLGAMAGGVIEYVSLITGYRALLIVVAGLYGLAFLTGRRKLTAAKAAQEGPAALAPTTALTAST
ncbi:MAG TPA: spermidine synthase [Streptosporangiaceae bacterium]|nr:spermidine synthase [Streptosporangiaceae bacterium]